jgi:uncharacterized membrane protein YphA (DoxX/SURF4 family)
MRPNPWHDAWQFMTQAGWFTPLFWFLLLGSLAIAVLAARSDPTQRSLRAFGRWLLRVLVGCMWWQQTLWKIPPNFDGLRYWMQQEAAHAAIPLQGQLVASVVLPNLNIFGPLVYLIEVAIGVSLLLGVLSRLGALLGTLMAFNLWLGLYSAPGEWPWTYMFLLIIEIRYLIDPPGRELGADALLHGRAGGRRGMLRSWIA